MRSNSHIPSLCAFVLQCLLLAPSAWAIGGFGPNGGGGSGGTSFTFPSANSAVVVNGAGTNFSGVAEVDGACLLGAGGVWTAGSCGGAGGGVPSIAGTANQINQVGSPGATTLSLSSTLVLPGTINGNTIPSASDTVVLLAATQTLTGKSIVATQLTGTLQAGQFPALTGDITTVAGALATTLATVNANVGTFGSATQCQIQTVNAKGLTTAASQVTCTPAFSSLTGTPTTIGGYGITDGLTTALANTKIFIGGAGGLAAAQTMSQDCTLGNTGVITCTKTNNVAFAASATTDALNATNISSGTLAAARMPAFTGDATSSAGATALTFATVNANVGTFGDATHCANFTVNGKGLITAAAHSTSCPGGAGGSGGGSGMWSGLPLTFATTTTQYAPYGGGGLPSATETAVSTKASGAASIANLHVTLDAAIGASATLTITLEDGTANASALTCATTSGGTSCDDATHSVNVANLDLLSWKLVSSGTVTSGLPQIKISYSIGTSGVGVTTLTAGTNITLSSGATCTASCTISAPSNVSYVANNFYFGQDQNSGGLAATVMSSTVTVWTPIFIGQPITISELGMKLTTASAGGNFQLAIYANSTSNLPTGAVLGKTTSISTTSTGILKAALVSNVSITTAGVYWIGAQSDNSVMAFAGQGANTTMSGFLVGVSTYTDLFNGSAANAQIWSTTGTTFATWPTNPTVTQASASNVNIGIPFFKVASIP